MFSAFKILVIYLIISSSCANILLPNGEKTTPSSVEQVKKEMNDFNEILKEIKEDRVRYKLEGKLGEVVKRAVGAENENKMLLQDKGTITLALELERKVSRSVLARATVEEFKNTFLIPKYLSPYAKNRYQIQKAYFKFLNDKNNDTAEKIRNEIIHQGYTLASFVEIAQMIYTEASGTIHTCYAAFQTAKTYDQYITAIKDAPSIKPNQEKVLLVIMGRFLHVKVQDRGFFNV